MLRSELDPDRSLVKRAVLMRQIPVDHLTDEEVLEISLRATDLLLYALAVEDPTMVFAGTEEGTLQ